MKIANKLSTQKQPLPKPIPLILEQYECKECKKKFYINKEDQRDDEKLSCPFCADNDVPNVREFDIEILALSDLTQL